MIFLPFILVLNFWLHMVAKVTGCLLVLEDPMSLPPSYLETVCMKLPNLAVVIGNEIVAGRSSSFGNTSSTVLHHPSPLFGTSPFLRINNKGQLVGRHLDFFGSTDWLRLGMELPRRFREDQSLPLVEETELGVDFCLTWSTDPR